ncbi:hypothetical protein GIB67_031096 [Kingdonia uniflora]|uniref:glycerophosphodiester phosphodiesterase n=1 Tax=Kingdonia uniflora TaxID=39325 RepID=A0A7J7LX88_9MAGN|nr:hypothetical protein GIB67_031096 [Kingdonia uniflora]
MFPMWLNSIRSRRMHYSARFPRVIGLPDEGDQGKYYIAFNAAGKFAVDFVEFDVQVTSDDCAVIFHDNFILTEQNLLVLIYNDPNLLVHVFQGTLWRRELRSLLQMNSFPMDPREILKIGADEQTAEYLSSVFPHKWRSEVYTDVRRNSLDEAVKLCLDNGLQGIVSQVKAVFKNPEAITKIKNHNLSFLTYGQLK